MTAINIDQAPWTECLYGDGSAHIWDRKEGEIKPAMYRALWGGRAGGKSHAIATALIVRAAERPTRILCCREIQNSIAASSKQLIEDKIAALGLSAAFTITDTDIVATNGSSFLFLGLGTNPDKVKSLEGIDIAWVEEAQAISQNSLDLLIPTIRKDGSEIWFSWNPDEETGPVDAMFRGGENPPPQSIVRKVTWRDNPHFSAVSRQQMETMRRRDLEKWAWVWEGAYRKRSNAIIFTHWRIVEFDTPADAHFRQGCDFGFAVDPSVLVRMFVGRFEDGVAIADLKGNCLFIDHEAYAYKCPTRQLGKLFDQIPGSRRTLIKGDSSRPETIADVQTQGFWIEGAKKGAGSVADGIEALQGFDIIVHPRCEHVGAEMGLYRFATDRKTGAVLSKVVDKDNHCIDAIRYAMEGVRCDSRAVHFVSSNDRGTIIDMFATDGQWAARSGKHHALVSMW